jgi:hypothetical protein
VQADLAILHLSDVQVLGLMCSQEQLGTEDSQCQGKTEPLDVSNTQYRIVPLRGYPAACRLLLSVFFVPAQ